MNKNLNKLIILDKIRKFFLRVLTPRTERERRVRPRQNGRGKERRKFG